MGSLDVLQADLGPHVRAFFTTRLGGYSPVPWDSLNLGLAVGDEPSRVQGNRDIVSQAAGAPVVFATQVHGTEVVVVDDAAPAAGTGDAMVTRRTDVALGVLVADCVPVLLADPIAGVVGTAHAGRRGFADGIIASVVGAMRALGAGGGLRAVVGPSICGSCYEVPAGLRAQVCAEHPAAWSTTSRGSPAIDLPAGVLAHLACLGVPATHLAACTMTDERFYSHRRATRARDAATTGDAASRPPHPRGPLTRVSAVTEGSQAGSRFAGSSASGVELDDTEQKRQDRTKVFTSDKKLSIVQQTGRFSGIVRLQTQR